MKVVGVDPAPKKAATIYDPTSRANDGWSTVDACMLPEYVSNLGSSEGGLLICWDAPLTAGEAGKAGCYYERQIERFFQTEKGWTVPKGISVRAYAGCPHWTVTRAAVGLPRVGRFDCANLPLALRAAGQPPTDGGKHIVEVHPAVAIWLWCQTGQEPPTDWLYKKDGEIREALWQAMSPVLGDLQPGRKPTGDDEFDAYVAFLLGSKWLATSGDVVLLGNERTGSFLIPTVNGLQEAFDRRFPG